MPTQLTPHFTLEELVGSTAAPASPAEVAALPVLVRANLTGLATLLERIRQAIGVPMRITSGYRGALENAEVGGVKTSQHLQGAAADFLPVGMTSADAYQKFLASAIGAGTLGNFGQLIVYPVKLPNGNGWSHIHASTLQGPSNVRQVLVAVPNQQATDTVFVAPTAFFGGAPAALPTLETPSPDFSDVAGGGSGGSGLTSSSPKPAAESGSAPVSSIWLTVAFVLLLVIGLVIYARR